MTCSIEIKNGRFRYNMWTKQKPNDTYTLFTSENGWIVKIDVMMEKITCHWINSGILSESDHKVFPLVDGRIILKDGLSFERSAVFKRKDFQDFLRKHHITNVKSLEKVKLSSLKWANTRGEQSSYKIWTDGELIHETTSASLEGYIDSYRLEDATWCLVAKASHKSGTADNDKHHYYSVTLYHNFESPLELDHVLPIVSLKCTDAYECHGRYGSQKTVQV